MAHKVVPHGKRIREEEEKFWGEVTGSRKRNHQRLDEQKEQQIKEAMKRLNANANNDNDIRRDVREEYLALRQTIENSNNKQQVDRNIGSGVSIPNPIFAYEDCMTGATAELTVVLNLAPNHEAYIFFMKLNPLQGAYLAYIESDINIHALRMLSEHNNTSLIAAKLNLQTSLLQKIEDAVLIARFDKVKRIISAFIQFKGEDVFLREVQGKSSMHQPLINNGILQYTTNNSLVFSESFRSRLNNIHVAATVTTMPRPRW